MDKIGWAWEDYKEDIKRIQKVLLDNGFEASLTECHDFWDNYSFERSATWLILPESDEDLFKELETMIYES